MRPRRLRPALALARRSRLLFALRRRRTGRTGLGNFGLGLCPSRTGDPAAHPLRLALERLPDRVGPEVEQLLGVSLVALFMKHALQAADRHFRFFEARAQRLVALE